MTEYRIEALTPETWDAYARLLERNNGVFGGCWCTWFHTMSWEKKHDWDGNRELKHRLVCEDRAHAALVFDGDDVVAWCQFGSPQELPNIRHRKQYEAESDLDPDYRVTCLFVDKSHRRRKVSDVALSGAVDLIAGAGGGVVEGYPHDKQGKREAVLYSGTRALFERHGFAYVRPKGTTNCVMRREVAATSSARAPR